MKFVKYVFTLGFLVASVAIIAMGKKKENYETRYPSAEIIAKYTGLSNSRYSPDSKRNIEKSPLSERKKIVKQRSGSCGLEVKNSFGDMNPRNITTNGS